MKRFGGLIVLALLLAACDSATSSVYGGNNGGGGGNGDFTNTTPPWHVTYLNTTPNTYGNPPTDSMLYNDGATVTVAGNTGTPLLTWTNFTLDGWNTLDNGGIDGGGGGTFYPLGTGTFTITSNVKLYGQWHQN